jgi:hypothetical protein
MTTQPLLQHNEPEPDSLEMEVETTAAFLDQLFCALRENRMPDLASRCVTRARALRHSLEDTRRLPSMGSKATINPADPPRGLARAPITPIAPNGLHLRTSARQSEDDPRSAATSYPAPGWTRRSGALSALIEQLRALAGSVHEAARDTLLRAVHALRDQADQLSQARSLLRGLIDPSDGFIRVRAHRWLNGLPMDSDVRLQIGQHPLEHRPVYGYTVNDSWIFDPHRSVCGRFAANPYKTYALTAREVTALNNANRRLDEVLRLTQQAKAPDASSDPETWDALLLNVRALLNESARERLDGLELRGTPEDVDRVLGILLEE